MTLNTLRTLLVGCGLLLLAMPEEARADAADGGWEDTSGDAEDEEKEEDTGCAHLGGSVSGLSLVLGAALAFGLRRNK